MNKSDQPTALQGRQTARLIRMTELLALTSLSRASVYRLMANDPHFPQPVKISRSTAKNAAVAFSLSEVQSWIANRVEHRGGQP